MRVTCTKNQLKEILFFAERNAGKSLNMPVLQGVHIKTENNKLIITSTNLETGFEGEIAARVDQGGEIVVPVRILSQLVSGMWGERIELESVGANLNVSSERTASLVKGYPVEDFPRIPKFKPVHTFTISKTELLIGLKAVLGSASTSNMKPEIASVFFYIQNRAPLKLVATDSFRLAEATTNSQIKDTESFLLPAKSAAELLRILESVENEIGVAFDKNQVCFSTKSLNFISRLTEGTFPGYESIIPKKFNTDVLVDKGDMVDALRAASIFSGNLREVSFNVLPEENLMEIRTAYSEVGEHTSQLAARVTGEKINMNFNYNYLLDGLLNATSDKVLLRFAENNRPLLIQNPDSSAYIYLVMPMKSV
jgi:DNA polymerase-3 subunit beta